MYNQLNGRNNDITSKWKFSFIKYMKRTIRLLKNYIYYSKLRYCNFIKIILKFKRD